MSKLKAAIGRTITQLLTSTRLQAWRRQRHARRRRGTPTVHFFYQHDDPYSPLLAACLPALQKKFAIQVVTHQVPPPDAAAAPELALLMDWSARDAQRLVDSLGLDLGQAPTPQAATPAQMAEGEALRKKLGHYLGATLYFEGEWYWGTDRLHYLEQRLVEAGLLNAGQSAAPQFAPPPLQLKSLPKPAADKRPVIHFYCSLRSPYTYIAARRARELASHYGAELRLRFVLPMVMRGLPVPWPKRLYIMRDTKREADRLGLPFGKIVDPVGKPVEDGLALLHAAIAKGQGSALLEAFLEGVFANGVDSGSAHGLESIGLQAGLTPAEQAKALQDESWRAVAEANRADMLARGIWGVPSFRVDEGATLWGQDRLWMIEQDLLKAMKLEA